MKKLFLFCSLGIVITSCTNGGSLPENFDQEAILEREMKNGKATIEDQIKGLIIDKYTINPDASDPINTITVTIEKEEGNYIQGSIHNWNGDDGATSSFLATDKNGQWEIVFEGRGQIDCRAAESYGFPESMLEECAGEGTLPENQQAVIVKKLFAEKYHKSPDVIIVMFEYVTENHLRGLVRMTDQANSMGLFLATDVKGEWEIVFDGNGTLYCGMVEGYDFPEYMISDCSTNTD
jgi:hypothetical protein